MFVRPKSVRTKQNTANAPPTKQLASTELLLLNFSSKIGAMTKVGNSTAAFRASLKGLSSPSLSISISLYTSPLSSSLISGSSSLFADTDHELSHLWLELFSFRRRIRALSSPPQTLSSLISGLITSSLSSSPIWVSSIVELDSNGAQGIVSQFLSQALSGFSIASPALSVCLKLS
ncbi:Uncharacterized protein Rs2_39434 [Raphanus sativus]|nr:Uncharacterized protein Rs2_39434 [Raphanus sativus]